MVKVHELDVCGGVAGKLLSVDGVMLHGTADDKPALEHAKRLKEASFEQLMKGFAHYFIDDKDDVRTEQTFNATYHAGNQQGNYHYISLETVCSAKTDKAKFMQAQQNTFWRAAIELRYYKLPVNRKTVRLHCELDVGTYTECPKRAMMEFGNWNSTMRQPQSSIDKVKDYFIKEIKKYYDNPSLIPGEPEKAKSPIVKEPHKPRHKVRSYWYSKGHPKLRELMIFCDRNKIFFELRNTGDFTLIEMRFFAQKSPSKEKLIKYLEDNTLNYDVKLEFYENV